MLRAHRAISTVLTSVCMAVRLAAQQAAMPIVTYTLRVDSLDLSGYDVVLRVRNASDTFRLALAAHPEYDDRFWRYVEHMEVDTPHGRGAVIREDSALWRVVTSGGESVVRYRIHLPPQTGRLRRAWVPFLASQGGLVGGMQSFMYVVGDTLASSCVTLALPATWRVATGLSPTRIDATFCAASAAELLDSPILIGRFKDWRFVVGGVPHRVVYLPLAEATPFDTAALVGGIERIVRQAIALFGRPPYASYTFLIQDGAFGALEHANSVTLGAPSDALARDLSDNLGEAAHEFFHTWNLVRIRPAGFGGVDYRPPPRPRGLWWGEGVTMYYADLLRRRAGLETSESTRTAHLERLMERYLGSPGNSRFSPESVSVVTNGTPPGALGDYSASVHLQGELLGTMLDLIIRDATQGRRSLDDVMRMMMARFSGAQGYTTPDVEATVTEVCACSVHAFFERYVRNAHPVDFDRYLALAGWRARVVWAPAVDSAGTPVPDHSVFAWLLAGDNLPHLLITDPASVWGKAGLHTGDRLAALDAAPITSVDSFRVVVGRLRVGDTVTVDVDRPAGRFSTRVIVAQLERPTVHIEDVPGATERQRAIRDAYLAGAPSIR